MPWFTHTQKKEKRKKKEKEKTQNDCTLSQLVSLRWEIFPPKLISAWFKLDFGLFWAFWSVSIVGRYDPMRPGSAWIGPIQCTLARVCVASAWVVKKKIIKIKNKKNWTWHRRTGSGVPHALSRRTRVRQAICRVHASQLILLQITNCSIKNNLWMGLDMLKIKFISSIPNYPSSHCPSF